MRNARVSLWLLALLVGVAGHLTRAAEIGEAAGAVEGTEQLDFYGPPLDEELDLQVTPLGMDDILTESRAPLSSDILGAPADADEDNPSLLVQLQEDAQERKEEQQKQQPWSEPTNDLTLVRFFHGRYYEGQYAHINEVLVREVDSADMQPNLKYLFEWLERERKRGVSLLNQATVEALEQLTALAPLAEGKRCDRDSYAILFKNDRATKGRAHKAPSKLGPLRRVDSIVHRLMMQHALDCFYAYPEKFNTIRFMELNQDLRRTVESFMDGIIGDATATKSKINAVKGKQAAKLAYSSLQMHAADDPNRRYLGQVVDERRGRMWVDNERMRALLKKYLVDPCHAYVQTLGPEVFIPARFDAVMMESEDRYSADSRLNAEFMHGWIHYRLCDLLVKRDEVALTKNLVDYINSISK